MAPHLHYRADDEASRALAAADPMLGDLIERIGAVDFTERESAFEFLVRSIVGQQLSGKAATSIYDRLAGGVGITPGALASATNADLRAAGLSARKAEYVSGIARAVVSGELDLDPGRFAGMTDDEVVADLTRVRGVGPWTVHMFLIFALGRPDVVADGDGGVRSTLGKLLGLGRPATAAEVCERAALWHPYASAALLYLWAASDSGEFLRADG